MSWRGRVSSPTRCKCGRTYDEHLRDKPRHLFQGFVWQGGEK